VIDRAGHTSREKFLKLLKTKEDALALGLVISSPQITLTELQQFPLNTLWNRKTGKSN
jgi:hypothetical protein